MSPGDASASGLATVVEAGSEFEAQTVVAVLADAGIEAHVFPLATIPIPNALRARPTGAMPVQVAAADLGRARAALAAAREAAANLDWDAVEVGDPPPDIAASLARSRGSRRLRTLAFALIALAALIVLTFVAASFPWRGAS